MDCFGTYFTHAQTCDNVRVQSATQWTASVHTLHMPKPVISFVFGIVRVQSADAHSLSHHVRTHTHKLLHHVSFASMCWHGRCYAMLTSLCHSCLRSHALAVTSCLIFFYVCTWDTRCYAMFTSASMKKIQKTKFARKKT